MATLIEKQKAFPGLVCRMLLWLSENNYEVTFGETYRPPETARLYAEDGKGISNSLHCVKLAIDLNLFRGGKYLRTNDDYRWAGQFWKGLSTGQLTCVWGGDWGDGNHFSIEHNGVK